MKARRSPRSGDEVSESLRSWWAASSDIGVVGLDRRCGDPRHQHDGGVWLRLWGGHEGEGSMAVCSCTKATTSVRPGIGIRLDTVPEVEDVAGVTTIVVKHLHCTIERNIHSCKYERWVKIALDGKVNPIRSRRNSCSPVETKNSDPLRTSIREGGRASDAEVNS